MWSSARVGVLVPIDFAPPKYAMVVNAMQERIANGTYPVGSLLPSEAALMREFGVSRPTIVRAFELLRRDGWIDAQQGKGRFALGKPAAPRGTPEHAAVLLTGEVGGEVRVLDAGPVPAPPRAASALDIAVGAAVVARRWLVTVDEVGPVELGTAYVPADLADGTDIGSPEPLRDGLLRHLTARRRIEVNHATQRISARPATADESRLLEIGRRDCVLTSLLAVCDRAGTPVFVLDVVLPPTRHELNDTFPIS